MQEEADLEVSGSQVVLELPAPGRSSISGGLRFDYHFRVDYHINDLYGNRIAFVVDDDSHLSLHTATIC